MNYRAWFYLTAVVLLTPAFGTMAGSPLPAEILTKASEAGRLTTNSTKGAVTIGSRVELFVDDWLIEKRQNVSLELQTPIRREIVLTLDKPWEGANSAYFTVFQEGSRVRLYYRGLAPADNSDQQVCCYAESVDGVNFVRPELGLYEFDGTKSNNIVYRGTEAHNFAPFLDANPEASADQKYKALGGLQSKLCAFGSPDGIHWKKIQAEPVLTKGAFDSLNIAFWDKVTKEYRCYSRFYRSGSHGGHRDIQSNTSKDFLHWSQPQPNRYVRGDDTDVLPDEHFYTSATVACPGAEHMYLAFPKRFLPDRKKFKDYPIAGVSDAMFMSSRDGVTWDRCFLEAWARPGPDPHNWTQRSNMPAWGIVESDPAEFSFYISEHYGWPDNRLRRLTVRRHGLASVHAGRSEGEFTTRPVTFSGANLVLNYSTSAAGSIQVEVQDETGKVAPGYALADMPVLFGDELDAVVTWNKNRDLSSLIGKPVRFRFVLRDADLFALRTQ